MTHSFNKMWRSLYGLLNKPIKKNVYSFVTIRCQQYYCSSAFVSCVKEKKKTMRCHWYMYSVCLLLFMSPISNRCGNTKQSCWTYCQCTLMIVAYNTLISNTLPVLNITSNTVVTSVLQCLTFKRCMEECFFPIFNMCTIPVGYTVLWENLTKL